jgi:hypothetical protein
MAGKPEGRYMDSEKLNSFQGYPAQLFATLEKILTITHSTQQNPS